MNRRRAPALTRASAKSPDVAPRPPFRAVAEPPIHQWRPQPADPGRLNVRPAQNAVVIATGHQASLWHPGILAKYLALTHAARRFNAEACHVVVDQDLYDAVALDVPYLDEGRLRVRRLHLGQTRLDLPPGVQPPIDPQVALRRIDHLRDELGERACVNLDRLRDAWRAEPEGVNLADQMAQVLEALMAPWTGPIRRIHASELMTTDVGRGLVDRLLAEPWQAVRAYNRAAAAVPAAGIRPLLTSLDVLEAPLWRLGPGGRQPVYLELIGSREARLVTPLGEPIEPDQPGLGHRLAPRALMLTAIMRLGLCDLFIHGTGGGVYDRITDAWLAEWLGAAPAPFAVATADLHLPFPNDAVMATPDDLAHAHWLAHHVPHNVDRIAPVAPDDPRLVAKERILDAMDDDRDPLRRRGLYRELQRINRSLAASHPDTVIAAEQALAQTKVGVANHALASRRDWCFALYPEAAIDRLNQALAPSDAESLP